MRLDEYLIAENLVAELRVARGMIMAQKVIVNDETITKPGFNVKATDVVRLRNVKEYVSRAAHKIADCFNEFNFNITNKTVLDIGSSTGGFTQVLLEQGAKKVFCLDVSYGFLDGRLRQDKRVKLYERQNIMKTAIADFEESPQSFVSDLSFIHPIRVLKYLCTWNIKNFEGLFLFKPQFYTDSEHLNKGVLPESRLDEVRVQFEEELKSLNVEILNQKNSSIKGSKGNQEIVYYLKINSI